MSEFWDEAIDGYLDTSEIAASEFYGDNLCYIMDKLDMNVETLSVRSGINRVQISRYRNGHSVPTFENGLKMLDVFWSEIRRRLW